MRTRWKSIMTILACIGLSAGRVTAAQTAGPAAGPQGANLAFVGRIVSDLDRSVAFYKAIGFSQDPLADPGWRRDEVVEHLYGIRKVQTRMAKMYVINQDSGQHFVVYLREIKGLPRQDVSRHDAWRAGSSHFGFVVTDADALWSDLGNKGLLRARSWGGKLVAPPGQTKGLLAYMTDPDGLDIEFINQRPATAAADGRPARPALTPGVNHVGLVVLDSDKAKAFYGGILGGQLQGTEAPWMSGDFTDSAIGAHGNVLRFFNLSFPEEIDHSVAMNFELVEFQNRRDPPLDCRITDIGVGYVGFEVRDLDAVLARVRATGARMVSDGIVTMRSGTREVMVRDPDVGGFVELFEQPKK